MQRRAPIASRVVTAIATLALIGVVSLWTPFLEPDLHARWFALAADPLPAPVPVLVALAAFVLFRGLRPGATSSPFLARSACSCCAISASASASIPYIVPTSVTIWEAAAPDDSLAFLLVGAVVLVPLILAYTAYSYWVFRGKVERAGGYH